MNLQYERLQSLCQSLKLPAMGDSYSDIAQMAAKEDLSYADFLERLLRVEIL
jgi:hypothetical protein